MTRHGTTVLVADQDGTPLISIGEPQMTEDTPDFLDGARLEYRECLEVRRLLGYLWTATGKNHLRPVYTLFDENDPIVEDIARLAIFPEGSLLENPGGTE